MGPANGGAKRPLSQINVTPLVDVMLVLLIIFMVTAPMMQEGLEVNLPKVEAGAVSHEEDPIVVTVDSRRRVFIGPRQVKAGELKAKLEAIRKSRKHTMVLLKADEGVPYGAVISAMAEIRKAGIDRVGMITEPPGGP